MHRIDETNAIGGVIVNPVTEQEQLEQLAVNTIRMLAADGVQ